MLSGGHLDGSPRHASVLVFDDEPVILQFLAAALKREGYHVTTTPDGDEALGLFAGGHRFDLAIADLGLRQGDGRHLVGGIKELSPGTLIVAMTAYPTTEVVRFAEEHAQAFLTKPFNIGDLLAVVRGVLSQRSAADGGREPGFVPREELAVAAGGA
jgi:DNA-binding response OmpR family regulator